MLYSGSIHSVNNILCVLNLYCLECVASYAMFYSELLNDVMYTAKQIICSFCDGKSSDAQTCS